MSDLDVLREFAPDAPLLSSAELSQARHHVLTTIAGGRAASASGVRPPRAELRTGLARRIAIGGVTVAAAAAITAGILVGTHRSAPAVVTVPAQLTAGEVLEHAATAALKEPVVVPRGDQFVYTKVSEGAGAAVVQSWLSVDGRRNGLTESRANGKTYTSVQPGCVNGARCTPVRAYFPGMPASAAAMGPWLTRVQGIRVNDLNDLSKMVGFMLESDDILPAQRAALYRFLATTPGLTLDPHVRDVSGRPGIGVVWHIEDGTKAMNVFDPRTFAYLGMTTWGEQGQVGGAALVQTAVVDRAGEVP